MEWNRSRSILLSLCAVVLFAVVLLVTDALAVPLCMQACQVFLSLEGEELPLTLTVYIASVPGWICLYSLFRLLLNLRRGAVFTAVNGRYMRRTSWCCILAGVLFLAAAWFWLPFVFAGIAAGFMGLIVRIVKNIFEQAIAMKDELDYTI